MNLKINHFFILLGYFVFIIGLVHYFELLSLNTLSYGSDSLLYIEQALSYKFSDIQGIGHSGKTYVYLLKILYIFGHYDVVITNIFTFSCLYLLTVYFIIKQLRVVNIKNFIICFVIFSNTLILWNVVKGAKEIIIIISFGFFLLSIDKKLKLHTIVLLIIAVVLLNNNRYMMGYMFIIPFFISRLNFNIRSIIITSMLLLFIIFNYGDDIGYKLSDHSRSVYYDNDFERSSGLIKFLSFDYIINSARFILGPGPYRSFMQILYGNVFIVSSDFGDYLIFIGSTVWWLTITYIILNIFRIKYTRSVKFSIIITTLHVLTYSIIYQGTGDTRHRALLYIFTTPIVISILNEKNINNKFYRKSHS